MIKKLVVVLTIAVLFVGCSRVSDETLLKAHEAVDNGALIIDVRTTEEYKTSHIEGAVNIPIKVFKTQLSKLDKERSIVVYCASGSRSAHAAKFLKEKGYSVYNVATQEDWQREINVK